MRRRHVDNYMSGMEHLVNTGHTLIRDPEHVVPMEEGGKYWWPLDVTKPRRDYTGSLMLLHGIIWQSIPPPSPPAPAEDMILWWSRAPWRLLMPKPHRGYIDTSSVIIGP